MGRCSIPDDVMTAEAGMDTQFATLFVIITVLHFFEISFIKIFVTDVFVFISKQSIQRRKDKDFCF